MPHPMARPVVDPSRSALALLAAAVVLSSTPGRAGEPAPARTGAAELPDALAPLVERLRTHRPIVEDDVAALDPGGLRVLRNAIFASRGLVFRSADLRELFARLPWYAPAHASVTALLDATDRENLRIIGDAEASAAARSFTEVEGDGAWQALDALVSAQDAKRKPGRLEQALVGLWEEIPDTASGWADVYLFYPGGRVAYRFNQMDCAKRLLARVGDYRVRGSSLVIRWFAELVAVGGTMEEAAGSCGSDAALEGAEPKLERVREQEVRLEVSALAPGEDLDGDGQPEGRPSRRFGGKTFWKKSDDPGAYR